MQLVSFSGVKILCDLQLRESIALVVSSIDERSPLLPAFQIANSTTPQVTADPPDHFGIADPQLILYIFFYRCMRRVQKQFENIWQNHSPWIT